MAYESTIALTLDTTPAEQKANDLAKKIQEKLNSFTIGFTSIDQQLAKINQVMDAFNKMNIGNKLADSLDRELKKSEDKIKQSTKKVEDYYKAQDAAITISRKKALDEQLRLEREFNNKVSAEKEKGFRAIASASKIAKVSKSVWESEYKAFAELEDRKVAAAQSSAKKRMDIQRQEIESAKAAISMMGKLSETQARVGTSRNVVAPGATTGISAALGMKQAVKEVEQANTEIVNDTKKTVSEMEGEYNKLKATLGSLARSFASSDLFTGTGFGSLGSRIPMRGGSYRTQADTLLSKAFTADINIKEAIKAGDIDKAKQYTKELKNLEAELTRVRNSARKLQDSLDILKKIPSALAGAAGVAGIGGFITGLLSIYSTINALKGAFDKLVEANSVIALFSTITGSIEGAKVEMDWLIESSNKLGVSFSNAALPFAKFAAAAQDAFSVEQMRGMYENVQKVAVAMHMGSEETKGLFYALQQMLSKGTVSAEELKRQFAERVPGAMQVAADSMGLSMEDFLDRLHKGLIRSDRFVEKFLQGMGDRFTMAAKIAADSFYGAFARMETAWSALWMRISTGEVAPEAFKRLFVKITEIINNPALGQGIETILTAVLDTITGAIDQLQKVGIEKIFGDLVNFGKQFLEVLGIIGKALLETAKSILEMKNAWKDFVEYAKFNDPETGKGLFTSSAEDFSSFIKRAFLDKTTEQSVTDSVRNYVAKALKDKGFGDDVAKNLSKSFEVSDTAFFEFMKGGQGAAEQSVEFKRKIDELAQAHSDLKTNILGVGDAFDSNSIKIATQEDKIKALKTQIEISNESIKNMDVDYKKMQEANRDKVLLAKGAKSPADIAYAKNEVLVEDIKKASAELTAAEKSFDEATKKRLVFTSSAIDMSKEQNLSERNRLDQEVISLDKKRKNLNITLTSMQVEQQKLVGDFSAAAKERMKEQEDQQENLIQAQLAYNQTLVDMDRIATRAFDASSMSLEEIRKNIEGTGELLSKMTPSQPMSLTAGYSSNVDLRTEQGIANIPNMLKDAKEQLDLVKREMSSITDTQSEEFKLYESQVISLKKTIEDFSDFTIVVNKKTALSWNDPLVQMYPLIDQLKFYHVELAKTQEEINQSRVTGANTKQLESKFSDIKSFWSAAKTRLDEVYARNDELIQSNYEVANSYRFITEELQTMTSIDALLDKKGMAAIPEMLATAQEAAKKAAEFRMEADRLRGAIDASRAAEAVGKPATMNQDEIKASLEKIVELKTKGALQDQLSADANNKAANYLNDAKKHLQEMNDEVKSGWTEVFKGSKQAQFDQLVKELGTDKTAEIQDYLNQLELQDFVRNSGLALDDLSSTFADTFSSILDGTKSFTEAMGEMFDNLVNNIINSSMKMITDNLLGMLTGSGGSWGNLAIGAAVAGGAMLLKSFSKTATKKTSSSMRETQMDVGVSQMQTADIFGTQTGYEYASRAAADFNKSLRDLELTVIGNLDKFSNLFSGLGSKLASLPIIKQFTDFISPVTNALKTGAEWLTSTVDAVGSVIYETFSGVASLFSSSVSAFSSTVSASWSAGISNMSNTFAGSAQAAEAAQSIGQTATSKMLESTLYAMQFFKAMYDLYDFFANLDTLFDRGIIAGIGKIISTIGSVVSLFNAKIGAIISFVGTVMQMFAEVPNPEVFMSVRNNLKAAEKYGRDLSRDITAKVWDGFTEISTETPLGVRRIAIHAAEVSKAQMEKSFIPLLKALKKVDIQIVDSVNAIDAAVGQAGQTMAYYFSGKTRKVAEIKQPLEDMDMAAAVRSNYKSVTKLMKLSGTEAGKALYTWYDLLIKKFVGAASTNLSKSIAVMASLTAKNEQTGQYALEVFAKYVDFASFISKNIKGVKLGRTAEQVTQEILDVFTAVDFAKEGLKKLGAPVDNARITKFLTTINGFGFQVKETAASLVVYSDILMGINDKIKYSGDALMTIFETKLEGLKKAGKEAMEISAYFSVFGNLAKLFKETSVKFTEADLSNTSDSITSMAKASQEAAKVIVDKAIKENKLTKLTRESAIATLIKAGKLEEATVAEADYGASVDKLTKSFFNNAGFIQQIASIVDKSLGDLGISADQFVKAANNVEKVFGSLEDAGKWLQDTLQAFKSPGSFAAFKVKTAKTNLSNLAASAGIQNFDEAAVKEMLKSPEQIAGFITKLATSTGQSADVIVKLIDAVKAKVEAANELSGVIENIQSVMLGDTAFGVMKTTELKAKVLESAKSFKELAGMTVDQMLMEFKSFVGGTRFADLYDLYENSSDDVINLYDALTELQDQLNSTSSTTSETATALDKFMRPFKEMAAIRALSEDMQGFIKNLYSVRDAFEETTRNAQLAGASAEDMAFLFAQSSLDLAKAYQEGTDSINSALEAFTDSAMSTVDKLKQAISEPSSYLADKSQSLEAKIGVTSDSQKLLSLWSDLGDAYVEQYNKVESIIDAVKSAKNSIQESIDTTKIEMGLTTQAQINQSKEAKLRAELASATDPTEQIRLVGELQSVITARYSDEIAAVKEIQDLVDSIGKYVKSLKLSDKSVLSNQARLEEARTQYQTTLAKAKSGDVEAMRQVTDVADTFLTESKAFYASSPDYANIFNQVTDELTALGTSQTGSIDVQTQIKDIQDASLVKLNDLDTLLNSILTTNTQTKTDLSSKIQGVINSVNALTVKQTQQAEIDKAILTDYYTKVTGYLEAIKNNFSPIAIGQAVADAIVGTGLFNNLTPTSSTVTTTPTTTTNPLSLASSPSTTVGITSAIPSTTNTFGTSTLSLASSPSTTVGVISAIPSTTNTFGTSTLSLASSPSTTWGRARFAKGGAFSNGVVSSPTNFNIGLMGEAGPEAVMPLTRGSDGSLGVSAGGGLVSAIESLADRIEASDQASSESQITELKALVKAQVATAQALIDRLDRMNGSLTTMERKARLEATA